MGASGRLAVVALLELLPVFPGRAHDTISTKLLWTQEISRLVYRHCGSCHHEGGTAMSLMTYEEARPWAKSIRDEVLARRMPPWGAVKGVGEFRNDPSLSQIEIDTIVNWVEGGAPKGDEIYLPVEPRFSKNAGSAPAGRSLALTTGTAFTLMAEAELVDLRPVRLASGDSLEVTSYQPDGSVRKLIWIRDWHPQWARTYFFLHPVRLPKGTRLVVYSGKPAEVAVGLSPD